ncbi:hypothetical protein [uncultured Amnibacterium sp.]|uniref:arsenate reductase/protein-tyrosine-phosphatase family protein n=1 Tax=uncultured Amnibacterium sp. TaxID=1631851 RepID=UPI0035CB9BA6
MGSADDGLHGRVLVVCTANVCRSPLAAALLADAFPALQVLSAGVQAPVGAAMCTVSATRLPRGAADAHVARQLTRSLVDGSDLVVTLEREHRAAAVRLSPGSQSKVFTLREVAALSRGLADRGAPQPSDARALAAALHGVRGIVPIPAAPPPRRRWWQRPVEPEDALTIVDGHGRRPQEHELAVDQVASTVRDAATAIRALRAS